MNKNSILALAAVSAVLSGDIPYRVQRERESTKRRMRIGDSVGQADKAIARNRRRNKQARASRKINRQGS